jgi:DNA repair protein RecN (Recombination protein N)
MLNQLTIKNFAIIDDAELNFSNGYYSLTGDTGAGKSIIIDALGILLGDKASPSYVKEGKKSASIEGIFSYSKDYYEFYEQFSLDEEDLIISKEIKSDGRTIIRLNGIVTTNAIIKTLAPLLVDIHSQHDVMYLFNKKYYLNLVDKYSDILNNPIYIQYQESYKKYLTSLDKVRNLKEIHLTNEEVELITFQIKEIENFNYSKDEDQELINEENTLGILEKDLTFYQNAQQCLENDALTSNIYQAYKYIDKAKEENTYASELYEIYEKIKTISSSIKSHIQQNSNIEERLNYIRGRLYQISRFKMKYGQSYDLINEKLFELQNRLGNFENYNDMKIQYIQEHEFYKNELEKLSQKLTALRKESAKKLEIEVQGHLSSVDLQNAVFEISFTKTNFESNGSDAIEFLVSMNKGVSVKPLSQVASGGELSRFMLCLKIVFNRLKNIHTLILDEIDSGISGGTAKKVAEKLKQLSQDVQVIVISHLPQVIAKSGYQYHVTKVSTDSSTYTEVKLLEKDERINILAKLISGSLTPASISAAKELLEECA